MINEKEVNVLIEYHFVFYQDDLITKHEANPTRYSTSCNIEAESPEEAIRLFNLKHPNAEFLGMKKKDF